MTKPIKFPTEIHKQSESFVWIIQGSNGLDCQRVPIPDGQCQWGRGEKQSQEKSHIIKHMRMRTILLTTINAR